MITEKDVLRWKNLSWRKRRQLRKKYRHVTYEEAYRTLEWEEYTYLVLSQCNYIILSGGGSLLPDIMKTPVADRPTQAEARKHFLDKFLKDINNK